MKNLISMLVFIGFMTTANAQTVIYHGSLKDLKPSGDHEFVMAKYPVGNTNGYAYRLDSNFIMIDSVDVPNYHFDGVANPPVEGSPLYYGSYVKHVTHNQDHFINGITYSSFVNNTYTGAVYHVNANGQKKNLIPYLNTGIGEIQDKDGKVYVSFSVSPGSNLGTGKQGMQGSSAVICHPDYSFNPNTGVHTTGIIIADTLADSSATEAHKTYVVYYDSLYTIGKMTLMDNGNILLRSYNQYIDKTRYAILDGANPTLNSIYEPNFLCDTIVNGFSHMATLPNGTLALYDNRTDTIPLNFNGVDTNMVAPFGKVTILDSHFNILKNGFQCMKKLTVDYNDRGLSVVGNHIEYLYFGMTLSLNGNPIERQRDRGGNFLCVRDSMFYAYYFNSDSCALRKTADYHPDATLELNVNDDDPAVLGAYNYVDRYLGTDSLVPTSENISFLKFANASTYTSTTIGEIIPNSNQWLTIGNDQLGGIGKLYYDSLEDYYYTYAVTISDTATWTFYKRAKWLKVILTTDDVSTPLPPVNTAPIITAPSLIELYKDEVADTGVVVLDAQGDVFSVTIAQGSLPNGLILDSETGKITGIPNTAGDATFKVVATDSHGASNYKWMAIRIITLASVNDYGITLKVYPNPTTDFIHIDYANMTSYQLYNSWGQLVSSGKHHIVQISDLAIGLYTLVLYSDNKTVTRKVMKN